MSNTPNNIHQRNLRSSSKSSLIDNSTQAPIPSKQKAKTTPRNHNKNNSDRSIVQSITTPTNKRKADSTSPSSIEIDRPAKKTTNEMATNPITIDDIKQLLESHSATVADTIATKVQNEIKSLGEQLKTDLRNQVASINSKIDAIQSNFEEQIGAVQIKVNNCIDRANLSEDDVRRIAKLNELKIKGLPYSIDENLHEIFSSISQNIGYDLTLANHVPELSRMQTKKTAANELVPLPIVIVKFVAKHIRDRFYSLYLSKVRDKPLMTDYINLAQRGRVIVSDNLTAANQQLFVSAMKHKMDKSLAKIFTKDGLATVKKSTDSTPKTIRLARDLDLLISATASTLKTTTKGIPKQSVPTTTPSNTTTDTTVAVAATAAAKAAATEAAFDRNVNKPN